MACWGGAVEGQRASNKGFVWLFEKTVVGRVRELALDLANPDDGRCDILLTNLQNLVKLYFGRGEGKGVVEGKLDDVELERGSNGVGKSAREKALGEVEGSKDKMGWIGMYEPWQIRVAAVVEEVKTKIFPNVSQLPADLRREWQDLLKDMSSRLESSRNNDDNRIVRAALEIAQQFMDEQISDGEGWMGDWQKRWTKVLVELDEI